MSDVQYVDLHGDRVAYREAGSGEVVLLIHGMAGSSEAWQAVLPELAKQYRVIAPDLLGHGQSVKPRTDYSLGAFAANLRDLLDELGISRANIVGHSLGGGVAMQFLYNIPSTAGAWFWSAVVAWGPTWGGSCDCWPRLAPNLCCP